MLLPTAVNKAPEECRQAWWICRKLQVVGRRRQKTVPRIRDKEVAARGCGSGKNKNKIK